jgi:hypothetical protein
VVCPLDGSQFVVDDKSLPVEWGQEREREREEYGEEFLEEVRQRNRLAR